MPAATGYDPNGKEIREAAQAEVRERRAAWATNNEYYKGKHKKYFKDEKHSDNVIVNLVRQTIERLVAF